MPVHGQYKLRGFDHSNPSEIELFNMMAYHPTTLKSRGYWKPKYDYSSVKYLDYAKYSIFETSHRISRVQKDVLYVVADKLNKIVGWIWLYVDTAHPLPAAVITKLGLTPRNSRIYQLSYEKLMSEGWPAELVKKVKHVSIKHLTKERKGVIVEGLRLAIARLSRTYRMLYVHKRKLVLYAFVHHANLASNIVLERNGFTRLKKKYSYDGTLLYLWVKVA